VELENILNYHKHIDIKLGLVFEIGDSLKIAIDELEKYISK